MTEDGSRISSLLGSAGGHKPTLSVLLRNVDLSQQDDDDDEQTGRRRRDQEDDLPLVRPLSHDQFQGAEWDVNDFLLSKRHVALDDLKIELKQFLSGLKASLVGVINEEYETFISLSLGLKQASVSTSLNSIKRPVLGLRNEVAKVRDQLDAQRNELESLLDKKSAIRNESAQLNRLLQVDQLATKIQDLLLLQPGDASRSKDSTNGTTNGHAPSGRHESNAKRLERISSEYNQLVYLYSKALKCPFLDSLEPKISKLGDSLTSQLQATLADVLAATNRATDDRQRDDLFVLLRTFASLESYEAAESTIRSSLVTPFVVRTIRSDCLSVPTTTTSAPLEIKANEPVQVPEAYGKAPPRGSIAVPLARLYNDVLEFVSNDVVSLIEIAERAQATVQKSSTRSLLASNRTAGHHAASENKDKDDTDKVSEYRILSRVVFPEIVSRLTSELSSTTSGVSLFGAGRPAVFYENYMITRSFVSEVEQRAVTTLRSLEQLRSSDPYTQFLRRFQLPVYFQLRYKETVTNVERVFSASTSQPQSSSQSTTASSTELFLMPETEAIWKAVDSCWQRGVFIDELVARFWRLTLQLLVRYRTWIQRVAPASSSSTNNNLSAQAAAPTKSSSSSSRPTTPVPSSTTSSLFSANSNLSEDQQDDQTLRQCSVLVSDLVSLRSRMLQLWHERIRPAIQGRDHQDFDRNESEQNHHGDGHEGEQEGATMPMTVVEEAKRALETSLEQTTSVIVPALSDQIVSILVKRATKPLKSAGTVASQVRASSNRSSTSQTSSTAADSVEVSYFVYAILKDVKSWENGIGRFVDADMRIDWKKRVLEDVLVRYATILQSQKKAQDSLSWLKRGRQGLSFFGGGGGGGSSKEASRPTTPGAASDDGSATGGEAQDKFTIQMRADIRALAQDADSIGINVDQLEGWQTLQNAVKSGGGPGSQNLS